jgi:hypothetical protein
MPIRPVFLFDEGTQFDEMLIQFVSNFNFNPLL